MKKKKNKEVRTTIYVMFLNFYIDLMVALKVTGVNYFVSSIGVWKLQNKCYSYIHHSFINLYMFGEPKCEPSGPAD